ncbi:putative sugar transferase [Magnetofaba australis IT-1]|uniref:Putative sugar transferase n=1 Tax=Magnetofaba australis IT-1 TaxID=1434232 RepID=A0A1Y2K1L4_9PROT|nr:putative sugar transferase [Magnetofaba australis IT-1]
MTLLTLFSPLMLLVASAIWLFHPGQIIFSQRRGGLHGRPFTIYKFRTMWVSEDGADVQQAVSNDPRITPLGRWLRAWSLDELPQLFNVLRGDMRLVGPRPHALAHEATFKQQCPCYALRDVVKPGITGWAQLHGMRQEITCRADLAQRIQLDLAYVRARSFAWDLSILLKTPLAMIQPMGGAPHPQRRRRAPVMG